MFHCTNCNLDFTTKRGLDSHYKTKKHLNGTANKKFKCGCGRSFSFRQGLHNHKQSCTYVPTVTDTVTETVTTVDDDNNQTDVSGQIDRLRIENEQLRKVQEEMKHQISLLLDKYACSDPHGTTNNIENQTNNNTNNTINIHINAFGKENTDYLDDQAIVECIDRIFNSVPAILKRIHFDPDHPENHNIKITNKKLPYASVMGDNRTWKTVNKKDAIETMVAKGYNFLDEKYADTKNHLSKRRQQHFEGFQDKFADEDKEMHKQLMTNVELLVLNQGKD